jgi:hypothetical protein
MLTSSASWTTAQLRCRRSLKPSPQSFGFATPREGAARSAGRAWNSPIRALAIGRRASPISGVAPRLILRAAYRARAGNEGHGASQPATSRQAGSFSTPRASCRGCSGRRARFLHRGGPSPASTKRSGPGTTSMWLTAERSSPPQERRSRRVVRRLWLTRLCAGRSMRTSQPAERNRAREDV